nr:hypothetical protein [uncultured Sellimonas sp.]
MKKEVVFWLIMIAVILELMLSERAGTIIPLIILVPVSLYLIVDIIENGIKWEKVKNHDLER